MIDWVRRVFRGEMSGDWLVGLVWVGLGCEMSDLDLCCCVLWIRVYLLWISVISISLLISRSFAGKIGIFGSAECVLPLIMLRNPDVAVVVLSC